MGRGGAGNACSSCQSWIWTFVSMKWTYAECWAINSARNKIGNAAMCWVQERKCNTPQPSLSNLPLMNTQTLGRCFAIWPPTLFFFFFFCTRCKIVPLDSNDQSGPLCNAHSYSKYKSVYKYKRPLVHLCVPVNSCFSFFLFARTVRGPSVKSLCI